MTLDIPNHTINANPNSGLTLETFIDHSPVALARLDGDGNVIEANRAFHQLTRDCFMGGSKRLEDFIGDEDKEALDKLLSDVIKGERCAPVSLEFVPVKDEEPIVILTYATLIQPESDIGATLVLHMIDQTEQKNLEMRFAHSQKMQAVGQLAGGVAHDFNNLLTAMIGFCDLLLMRHPAGDPSFADIMQVKQNANRAANLVRQLLAFSRRQTLQPKIIDMTDVLAELSNLIRRLIGENIELNMMHGRNLGQVRADQGQLEQVIINLAVNARDAMTGGGTLSIETENVTISHAGPPERDMISPEEDDDITPGEYVLVKITDTGTGIPADIVTNIFEPFFSTKAVGSGTGLGLSTVYGIIKQTGGFIYVQTEDNVGTTFNLYFQAYAPQAAEATEAAEENKAGDLTGGETIMLVEDETPVRIFAARALGNKGYKVLEADCGESALEVFESHEGKIDMIISDVIMPGMNGPTMVDTLLNDHADRMKDTEIIFISGYAEDAFGDSFGPDREFNFLAKPFTLKQLAAKVKEVIQSKHSSDE
ncbi:MAG: ATP-binding protein [Rickettsiales bacterium]|nr:ATP-binding protein [Rickettsiales bacterium]